MAKNSHCTLYYNLFIESRKTHLNYEKPLKSDILFLKWNSDSHGLLRTRQMWIQLKLPYLTPTPTPTPIQC